MVDLSSGFGEFGKLNPNKKEDKKEELSLSGKTDDGVSLQIKSDMDKAEKFYTYARDFVRNVLDKVAEGREGEINAGEMLSVSEELCNNFSKGLEPDDLTRLVFLHDEYEKNYLYTHSVNVCLLSVRVALGLDLSKKEMHEVGVASLFRDGVMMKISGDVWNKDGKITTSEFKKIQQHPELGEEIFKKVNGVGDIVPLLIAQHHEKCDGTGYPKKLKKDDILFSARIIGLVNRYDAQTHTRLYKKRELPDRVIQNILDQETNSYDPEIMKVFLREISAFPVGSWIKLNSGEIGKIICVNKDMVMRPVVNIIFDRAKKRLKKSRELDLSKQLLMYVEECVDPDEVRGVDNA